MKRLAFSSGCVRVCIYMTLGGVKKTHEIRLSIDVSIGLVLIDLRKDARPGVNANELDGILSAQQGQLVCIESRRAQCDLDPDDSQPTKEKKTPPATTNSSTVLWHVVCRTRQRGSRAVVVVRGPGGRFSSSVVISFYSACRQQPVTMASSSSSPHTSSLTLFLSLLLLLPFFLSSHEDSRYTIVFNYSTYLLFLFSGFSFLSMIPPLKLFCLPGR